MHTLAPASLVCFLILFLHLRAVFRYNFFGGWGTSWRKNFPPFFLNVHTLSTFVNLSSHWILESSSDVHSVLLVVVLWAKNSQLMETCLRTFCIILLVGVHSSKLSTLGACTKQLWKSAYSWLSVPRLSVALSARNSANTTRQIFMKVSDLWYIL